MKRNPKAIAADLTAHLRRAEETATPPVALVVIGLAVEFVDAATDRMESAGLLNDPAPEPAPEPTT